MAMRVALSAFTPTARTVNNARRTVDPAVTTAAPPITAKSASTVTAMVTNGDAPGGKAPPMRNLTIVTRACALSPDKIKTESSLMLKSVPTCANASPVPWLAVKVPTVMAPFVTGDCKFGSPTKPTETCGAG